jgi:hypothetical protein
MWIDHRNYPGGPLGFYLVSEAAWYTATALAAGVAANILGDGLLVCPITPRWTSNRRLTQWLNRTVVPVLHNLGFTMAYHRLSGTDILGLLWYASCHTCHSFRGAAHHSEFVAFLSFFCFTVVSIITVVESAMPGTVILKGKPIKLAVPWVSLSVGLNIIVTSMICFRLMRMRARIRQVLSPELSNMYSSIATMLIESAAPLSILGTGLVVTAAQRGPLVFAFGYVWSMFCVESKSSLPWSRFASTQRRL